MRFIPTKYNVIKDINKSYSSLIPFDTRSMDGFTDRLRKQYGKNLLIGAINDSCLDPLRSAYMKKRIVGG
jgi:hypothetical protein